MDKSFNGHGQEAKKPDYLFVKSFSLKILSIISLKTCMILYNHETLGIDIECSVIILQNTLNDILLGLILSN